MNYVILFFIILFLLVNLLTKKILLPFKFIHFFRFLFPSWSFFDQSNDTPYLLFRVDESLKWQVVLEPKKSSLYNLFYNPKGNFYIAYLSQIMQFVNELYIVQENEKYNFENSSNYLMLKNFVAMKVQNEYPSSKKYQFKLAYAKKSNADSYEFDDILIGPFYDV